MRILPLIVVLACMVCQACARAQDNGEARAAPSRGLLKRGLLAKGKQTTTTTPAPQEEAEYEDEAEYAEAEGQEPSTEAPTSSTEGKKLVAGGVRPFRSNTDLLEALKRRRVQAAEDKKRLNSAVKESNSEDAPAPAAGKPARGRFGKPASRSVQESEPDEQNESTPPARSGRTFARRGGN